MIGTKSGPVDLETDELSVVVFPLPEDEGVVLYPDELDFELKQQAKKNR